LGSETKIGLVITGLFGVIAALVGASAFARFFIPVVEVAVNQTQPLDQPQTIRITVTNYGSEPADNLTLMISYPNSAFTHILNEFSTSDIILTNLNDSLKVPEAAEWEMLEVDEWENLTSKLNNPNYLELYMKKLTHGTGSKVVFTLGVEKPINWTDFDASAVYDQGSTSWATAGGLTYKGFIDNITKPGHAIAIVVIVIFVSSVLMWRQNRKRTSKRISEEAWVAVVGIAILVIYGVLYALGIFSPTNPKQIAVVPLVIFISSIMPRWQLFKIFYRYSDMKDKLKIISRREKIAVAGFSVLFVIGVLYAFGILNLTFSKQIIAILLIVGVLSWLVILWLYLKHYLKNKFQLVDTKQVFRYKKVFGYTILRTRQTILRTRQPSPKNSETVAICLFIAIRY
jgi:hypothetical protein